MLEVILDAAFLLGIDVLQEIGEQFLPHCGFLPSGMQNKPATRVTGLPMVALSDMLLTVTNRIIDKSGERPWLLSALGL